MTLPSNMATQAATGSTTWAKCAKIKTIDGLIVAVTNHDRSLTIDLGDGDGSQTYVPTDAVEFSDGRIAADLAVDAIEVVGALDSARITDEDLHAGRYENATVTFFEVDWTNAQVGQYIRLAGPVGQVETRAETHVFELRSFTALLGRKIGLTVGPSCPRSFGSTSATERKPLMPCGVNLNPNAWTATTAYSAALAGDRLVGSRVKPTTHTGWWFRCAVAGTSGGSEPTWPTTVDATVVDGGVTWAAERALAWPGTVTTGGTLTFSASGITVSEDFFSRGWVQWLTGDNAGRGVKSPVAYDDGAGAISLYRAPIVPIAIGDTFTIYAGCDKSKGACDGFSNWLNFGGFPDVPTRLV